MDGLLYLGTSDDQFQKVDMWIIFPCVSTGLSNDMVGSGGEKEGVAPRNRLIDEKLGAGPGRLLGKPQPTVHEYEAVAAI